MDNIIYTMGYVADNGDITICGKYRDREAENLICINISKERISVEVLRAEAGVPEPSVNLLRHIRLGCS